jgi:hypothetical protein
MLSPIAYEELYRTTRDRVTQPTVAVEKGNLIEHKIPADSTRNAATRSADLRR